MPTGLTETYEHIWSRITGKSFDTGKFPDPTERKWALKTLKLILRAKRPLSPEEILEATALEPEDTTFQSGRIVSSLDYLIQACGNFVALDLKTSRVRLVHYSVQEFLGSKDEFQTSEEMVTKAVFITLGQEYRGSGDSGGQFYTYATRYWEEHSRGLKTVDNELGVLIQRFLLNRTRFEEWRNKRQGLLHYPETPYQALAYFNLPVILQYLQQLGSHQDDVFALEQSKSLVLSASWGYTPLVTLFLSAGADVNFRNAKGVSSLHAAVTRGSETIVKLLLAAGADPKSLDPKGESCLHGAVVRCFEEIVKFLLAAGADGNCRNSEGISTLQLAVKRGSIRIVELLLAANVDTNSRDKNGRSSLDYAVVRDSRTIVQLLLNAHADVDLPDGRSVPAGYRSPLQQAVRNGSEKIVQLLLAAGANANVEDPTYGSPLRDAVSYGSERIVELLLTAGANVNTPDQTYGSVLEEAISCGSKDIVQQLIAAGAKVNTEGQASEFSSQTVFHLGINKVLELQEARKARESEVQLWPNVDVAGSAQVVDNVLALENIRALDNVQIFDDVQVLDNGHVSNNINVVYSTHLWGNI